MGHDLARFNTGISYRNILDLPPQLVEQVRLWRNSEHVRLNMLSQSIISAEKHREWIADLELNPDRQIVRVAFSEEVPFGIITLKDIDRSSSRSDWGMYIGERDFLGKRLARPMLFDLLVWAFEEEGFVRLFTSVLGDNTRAIRLYLEAGFHFEGRFEKHIRRESGKMADLYWLAFFGNTWDQRKNLLKDLWFPNQ